MTFRLVTHQGEQYLIVETSRGPRCSCRPRWHWQGVPCPHLDLPSVEPQQRLALTADA